MVIPQFSDIDPDILAILETVHDPEVPVLTVMDMGIIRKVEQDDKHVTLHISPTYSVVLPWIPFRMISRLLFQRKGIR